MGFYYLLSTFVVSISIGGHLLRALPGTWQATTIADALNGGTFIRASGRAGPDLRDEPLSSLLHSHVRPISSSIFVTSSTLLVYSNKLYLRLLCNCMGALYYTCYPEVQSLSKVY